MVAAAVTAVLALGVGGASAAPAQQDGTVSTASAAAVRPQLSYGSTGTWVKYWQADLNAYMHVELTCRPTLAVDGDFGDATLKATKCIQGKLGVTADGIVGTNTWGAMCDYLLYAPNTDEVVDAWYNSCR
ncbi:hypothetical protein GCM10010129_12950 [Streptomyces fumigatiscleroticus]|nr:hypothetical protein GCM10010129_12950 [Streptomyces fumigatiscleroticus]